MHLMPFYKAQNGKGAKLVRPVHARPLRWQGWKGGRGRGRKEGHGSRRKEQEGIGRKEGEGKGMKEGEGREEGGSLVFCILD